MGVALAHVARAHWIVRLALRAHAPRGHRVGDGLVPLSVLSRGSRGCHQCERSPRLRTRRILRCHYHSVSAARLPHARDLGTATLRRRPAFEISCALLQTLFGAKPFELNSIWSSPSLLLNLGICTPYGWTRRPAAPHSRMHAHCAGVCRHPVQDVLHHHCGHNAHRVRRELSPRPRQAPSPSRDHTLWYP